MRADAFTGMCVTYSFMYLLVRLLNPDKDPADIQAYMVRGTTQELTDRVKRLNRFALDVLRAHPRGSLRSL